MNNELDFPTKFPSIEIVVDTREGFELGEFIIWDCFIWIAISPSVLVATKKEDTLEPRYTTRIMRIGPAKQMEAIMDYNGPNTMALNMAEI